MNISSTSSSTATSAKLMINNEIKSSSIIEQNVSKYFSLMVLILIFYLIFLLLLRLNHNDDDNTEWITRHYYYDSLKNDEHLKNEMIQWNNQPIINVKIPIIKNIVRHYREKRKRKQNRIEEMATRLCNKIYPIINDAFNQVEMNKIKLKDKNKDDEMIKTPETIKCNLIRLNIKYKREIKITPKFNINKDENVLQDLN